MAREKGKLPTNNRGVAFRMVHASPARAAAAAAALNPPAVMTRGATTRGGGQRAAAAAIATNVTTAAAALNPRERLVLLSEDALIRCFI